MTDPYGEFRTEEGWRCPEHTRVGEEHRRHFSAAHGMHPTASAFRQEFLLERVVSQLTTLITIQIFLIFAGVAGAIIAAGSI